MGDQAESAASTPRRRKARAKREYVSQLIETYGRELASIKQNVERLNLSVQRLETIHAELLRETTSAGP